MAKVSKNIRVYKGEPRMRWVVRYTDLQKKPRERYFKLKRDADAYCADVVIELKNGTHESRAGGGNAKVREILRLYLNSVQQRVREGRLGRASASNIQLSLLKHLAPTFEHRKARQITTLEVEQWHAHLLKKLHPQTAKTVLHRAAAMEQYAEKRGIDRNTAFRDYCAEVKGVRGESVRTFTTEQMAHLLRVAELRPQHGDFAAHLKMRCLVHLAVFCGLRMGEIAGLTRKDLDLANGVTYVRHSITQYDEHKGPKSRAGYREVPVPPHLVNMLREWLIKHHVRNERDLVFLSRERKSCRAQTFHHSWRSLLGRAGLLAKPGEKQFRFHALRHFCASNWIKNGMPLPDLAVLMGHRRYDITLQHYAHSIIGGGRRREIVESAASDLLGPEFKNTTALQAEASSLVTRPRGHHIVQRAAASLLAPPVVENKLKTGS